MSTVTPPSMRTSRQSATKSATLPVGVYCRQSVEREDGGAYGSIEAQQDAVGAYVASQREHGWVLRGEPYSDLGVSGATTDRPALARLLRDVERGEVQVVAVYRLDRLSRCQADFYRLLEFFDQHDVTFVSVTENFNTTTPMGRFALGLLGQVAQLEREVTAERVRDKVRASRRRGLWTGGRPVLGYDVVDRTLQINADEAEQVREVFGLYLVLGSLGKLLDEVRRRRWRNKTWTNKKGQTVVGKPLSKTGLRNLLSNPLYVGKMPLGAEVHDGQQEAIVDQETWDRVQAALADHAREPRPGSRRTRSPALLAGLLRCAVCGSAMGAHHSIKDGRHYRYYVCQTLQKQGKAACPGSRISMGKMDGCVLDRIRALGRDPELVAATVAAARERLVMRTEELREGRATARKELGRLRRERQRLAEAGDGVGTPEVVERIAELDQAIVGTGEAVASGRVEIEALKGLQIDEQHLQAALEAFDGVWDELFPAEQARLLREVLKDITCDVRAGTVELDLRAEGIGRLLNQEAGR